MRLRLALAAGVALAFAGLPAAAATVTFDFTGGLQTYVAPVAGTYSITALGA